MHLVDKFDINLTKRTNNKILVLFNFMNMRTILLLIFFNIFIYNLNAVTIKELDVSDLTPKLIKTIQTIDSVHKGDFKIILDKMHKLFDNSIVKTSVDSAKTYYLISKLYNAINETDKGFKYIDKAININYKNDDRFKSIAYSSRASIYTSQSNYEKALFYYYKSLEIIKQLKDTLLISYTYNDIGLLYYYAGFNSKALEFLKKSSTLKSKYDSPEEIIKNNINIALIFVEMKEEDKALKYFYEYYDYYFKNDSLSTQMIIANFNIGLAYYSKEKYNKALQYFNKALDIAEKTKFLFGIAKSKYALADLYVELGNYKLARKIAEEVKGHGINSIEFWGYNNITLGYAKFKLKEKDYLLYFEAIEDSLKNKPNLKLQENLLEYQIKMSKSLNDYKKAFEYQVKIDSVRAELNENVLKIQIADLIVNKELEENKNEVLKLKFQNDLNEQKIRQSNNFILMLILFVLLLLTMIIFIYFQNQKIAKLNSDLNTSNSTIVRFFSIISHDLRSPIGTFKMIMDELDNNYNTFTEAEKRTLISESKNEVTNVLKLLENLLTWAKTSNGEFKLSIKQVSVKKVIEEIAANNKQVLNSKNINVVYDIQGDYLIETDEDMLKTIIRNICSNSIKFTPEGKSIYVNVSESSSEIILSIKDEGVGMNKKQLDKLFNIDQKVTRLGTQKEKGTGLGLIIVKELVEYLNGSIEVKSEEGSCTEVLIKLKK